MDAGGGGCNGVRDGGKKEWMEGGREEEMKGGIGRKIDGWGCMVKVEMG